MTSTTLLPRYLLPALSPMWRVAAAAAAPGRPATGALRQNAVWTIRYASSSSKLKAAGQKGPLILEKPAKFNPPSHGSRLPKKELPKHYGGQLSGQEVRAQRTREYPGMMAPEGTWAHWFLHNRSIHAWITLGTLTTLAVTSLYLNFTQTSPFKNLLPPLSDIWSHPITFFQTWIKVLQLHERDRNEKVIAMHTRHTDDVLKRQYYRKVHGLDKENPVANLFGMKQEEEDPEKQVVAVAASGAPAADDASPVAGNTEATNPAEGEKKKSRFGIF